MTHFEDDAELRRHYEATGHVLSAVHRQRERTVEWEPILYASRFASEVGSKNFIKSSKQWRAQLKLFEITRTIRTFR